MKVFLLTDKPNENNIEFYDILGRACELTVAFESYPDENDVWQYSNSGKSFKGMFLQGINFGSNLAVSFGIDRIIDEGDYDIYVTVGCETGAQKSFIREMVIKNKRFIIASEGAFPQVNESRMARRKTAGYLKSASFYLSCGSACDAYFSSYGVDMSSVYRYNYAAFTEKDFLYSNAINEKRKQGLIKRFRLNQNIFLSTMDFNYDQGVDILLETWKYGNIENGSLLLISDARMHKKLAKMVKNMALNDVVMINYQPKELMRELLRISKAFVYPVRYDAWGLPVVEALSCGTPVISSYNVGAVHDLVHNDITGYIQNIHEPISWGERMRELINRDILRENMGRNALESMRLFTIESRVKSYIEVFRKCALMQRR